MKHVQIPEELFVRLCMYFILDQEDEKLLAAIKSGLQAKLDAIARRDLYSTYKDSEASPEARERARKAYLDRVGMREDFRWEPDHDFFPRDQ